MNINLYSAISFMTLIFFSSCASTQKLESTTPFVLAKTTCRPWTAGIKGGGSGMEVLFVMHKVDATELVFEGVYFRDDYAKLEDKGVAGKYHAKFTNKNKKPDIIMHADGRKEGGNTAPELNTVKVPFEIKPNEAVLVYTQSGTTKYFKVKDIKEVAPLIYPSARPRN